MFAMHEHFRSEKKGMANEEKGAYREGYLVAEHMKNGEVILCLSPELPPFADQDIVYVKVYIAFEASRGVSEAPDV